MEFLEAIAEGMPPRAAAAIAQIPFETVRNWMSNNPKARKTSYSDVCKSERAEHRRNSGERSKATELGLVGARRFLKESAAATS